jgi:hypothetical protein
VNPALISELENATSPEKVADVLKKIIEEHNNQILCRDAYYLAINFVTNKTSQECLMAVDKLLQCTNATYCDLVNAFISALIAIGDESDSILK